MKRAFAVLPKHPRMVAYISEPEPGIFVVEPMHYLSLAEARAEAKPVRDRRSRFTA